MNDRNSSEYWKRVARLVIRTARRNGLSRDDAEDCAVEFELMVLANGPMDLDAPGVLDLLRQRLLWHVRTCIHRRNRECRGVVHLTQLLEDAAAGIGREPVSPVPGPEELAIERDELEKALRIVGGLPARQKWLWYRVVMDCERIVDLQARSGRSANALYLEMRRIREAVHAACLTG